MMYSRKKVFSLIVVASVIVTAPLLGQQKKPTIPIPPPPAKVAKAAIAGVVIDSLHGRYLAGAEVIVQGANVTRVTDSLGKFRVDSLAPGTYQVGVFHPLLDTLGTSLATRPFYVGADSTSFVVLAVPSAATIIRRSCPPPGPRSQGSSAVIGHVTDPESLDPVPGADVSIAWTQLEISKEVGVRRTPRLLRDSTDAHGEFRICNIPSSMQATLQARKGRRMTAEIPIAIGDGETELFARTLLLTKADSGAKTGNAIVSGRVTLEGAPSNAGSRVEVVGTDAIALTNEKGEFTIRNLPSGTHVLLARHLGFGAETVPVDLSSREPKQVTIKLPKYVAMLDPVTVTARRQASLDKVGFNQRMKSGVGYYLGPEQIQAMHPNYLTDILRRVPSLRIQSTPTGDVVTSSRGVTSLSGNSGCVQYYVDDMPWMSATPGDINDFVNGNEVVGVEVYAGPGAPVQYTRGMQDCTTVVLWTKFKIRDR
jgi:CarboxypepD_reg-like domain/Carboxypeptidase regulatory-like domain/TonB-dependent Receptor Plug Domain